MKLRPHRSLVFLLLLTPALGLSQPRIEPDHPRIFLRSRDIADLQQRCRSYPEVKNVYDELRAFAFGSAKHSNPWIAPDQLSSILTVYLVENRDPKLLVRARDFLATSMQAEGDGWTRPRMLKAIAHAYDWLHPDLAEAERRLLADRMRQLVSQIRQEYRHSDYNNHVYLQYGPLLYAGLALAGEGWDDDWAQDLLKEGHDLLTQHFIPTVNQLGAHGQGGWHESMSYWSFFAYEFAHQLEAWRTGTGEDLFPLCPGLGGAATWLTYCTRPYDQSFAPVGDINTPVRADWQELAYLPLLARRYQDGLAQHLARQISPDKASRSWPFILWYDPSVRPTQPRSLPLATLFPGVGWAAMRSSWDADAVWALFICGDYYAGHQHSDQNSFIVARQGDLAIDAGEYGAKETLFHNTVLLGSGQRLYATDPRRFFAPTTPRSQFDTGDILAFEEHQLFTFVLADASNAYGSFGDAERLSPAPLFLRRFIFLKPDTFVVDDQIRLAQEDQPVRWLLHAHQKPAIDGRTIRIRDGDGELVCQTLWPDPAAIADSLQSGGNRPRTHHVVEVLPPVEAGQARLVHVLQARAHNSTEPPAKSELTARDGQLELAVSLAQRAFKLTLPPPSQGAGTISVLNPRGQPVLQPRPLPAGILPYTATDQPMLVRWDAAYQGRGPAAWETGRPSSELRKTVEGGTVQPGRALELGCGSGRNAVYLAGRGFRVTALDIAPTALVIAENHAREAGVAVDWLLADVLAPPRLEPFDFIFDRGCYHGLRQQSARAYRDALLRLTRPGSLVLILAGNANEPPPHYGPPRVTEAELRGDFADSFDFQDLHPIHFDTSDPSRPGALAWSVLLRRKP